MSVVNALTIDFEDWYHGLEIPFQDWQRYERRIDYSAAKVLTLLEELNVKATFFFLGFLAESCPHLVRDVVRGGHRLGTHGYSHEYVYRQTPEVFARELRKSVQILEDISGEKVSGFRAPYFSITKKSLWALDILLDLGIHYDSSIFPVVYYRYGIPDACPNLHKRATVRGREIWEVPITTLPVFGKNIPFSGGAYFRILPYQLVNLAFKKVNKDGHPVIVYIHPWEFDPDQPILSVPRKIKLLHYYGLQGAEKKLRQLLRDFKFTTIEELLKNYE